MIKTKRNKEKPAVSFHSRTFVLKERVKFEMKLIFVNNEKHVHFNEVQDKIFYTQKWVIGF